MSAWVSAADEAKRRLTPRPGASPLVEPESTVDEVFAVLAEPDGDMIRAGMRALADEGRQATARQIVLAVWEAMLRAAS